MGRPCTLGPITKSAIRTKRCRERQRKMEKEKIAIIEEMEGEIQDLRTQLEEIERQNELLKVVGELKAIMESERKREQMTLTDPRKKDSVDKITSTEEPVFQDAKHPGVCCI
ncbi:hypothetical protein QR680_006104 [Steinernema hermaphroditum]|uniref:BZIP domain-containing protein n=1 Tax=Steinernema hermaphroditum TaxID=289476 RepID=A0AA39LWJ7_9BILA|nr:hypothetical protein QR680_006104 [Steinernema hermaphroditum]